MDDDIEVKVSELGRLVPGHLLEFHADMNLQTYFRGLIVENYEKGLSHSQCGVCVSCYTSLTVHDQPRIRPGFKQRGDLAKLMGKSKTGKLRKSQEKLLTRSLDSPCFMKVKCPSCGFVNRRALFSLRDSRAHRADLHHHTAVQDAGNEGMEEETVVTEKKKRKRKKKGKDSDIDLKQSPHGTADKAEEMSNPASVSLKARKSGTPSAPQKLSMYRTSNQPSHQCGKKLFKHKQALQAFLSDQEGIKQGSLKDFLSSL